MAGDAPITPGTVAELDAGAVRRACDPARLGFGSTFEVKPSDGVIGQARADEAIAFGLAAESSGYNIFVTGPVGTGKRTSLQARLHTYAARRPPSMDWVYVHNFRDPRAPVAIQVPSGRGRDLAADMRRFLQDARRDLTAAFESETYAQRRRQVVEPLEQEQEGALAELRAEALGRGIALELTPAGLATFPVRDKQPLTPEQFAQLPEQVQLGYQRRLEELAPKMQAFLRRIRGIQREGRDRLRALEREVALFAIGHLVDELKERHAHSEKLEQWFAAVAEDVTENLSLFASTGQEDAHDGRDGAEALLAAVGGGPAGLGRYEVNAFVTHEADDGAPVVFETNPTYANLFGRIEHHGVLGGGFVTDHRMLRSGAIHRANGGYLMLPAQEVLGQSLVWRKLKDVLHRAQIRLENPAEEYALLPSASLIPEQIELDLKVILIGSPPLYELAYMVDEDVRKLFRVKAEFDWRVPWDDAGERAYAAFLSAQVRTAGLRHFGAHAVARIVEHGARLAEGREWLSTRFIEIAGLAAEASHWAGQDHCEAVGTAHVERAIEHKQRRSNLIEERLLEMVADGSLLLDVDGTRVGQINGLAVLDLGDYTFGRPVRITASAGPGRGTLLSIERETELSGHIHDKGFLTLSGYLRERYGTEERIALAATLTFEQSYDRIDGDSAASAELYALLSELSGLPLRQDIAVTGSVNQHGELQAIGGVNEKIEGFHRACALGGLTGSQGVIIPAANVRNLMLSPELTDRIRAGTFHVWSAADIEGAIELLTGVPAGVRDEDGGYPEGTVHGRVATRLRAWARLDQEKPGNGAIYGTHTVGSPDAPGPSPA